MTEYEKIVATAYTDTMFVNDFSEVHKYIEKKLGRLVWTHEFASTKLWDEIKDAVRPDFMAMIGKEDT